MNPFLDKYIVEWLGGTPPVGSLTAALRPPVHSARDLRYGGERKVRGQTTHQLLGCQHVSHL